MPYLYDRANSRWALAATPLLLAVAACGGGSGGVSSTPAPVGFTSFSAVPVNTPTSVAGMTREGSVRVETTGAILASGVTIPNESNGSATFTLDNSRLISGLSISGSQSSVNFNSQNSTATPLYIGNSQVATAVVGGSGADQALYANPYTLGFNYQTFGVWGSGLVRGSTGKFGATSVGSATSTPSIPTSGSAVFQGYAGGIYTYGTVYRYAANATFNVDFSARTVAMSTSNQVINDITTGVTSSTNMLQINGVMSYAQGTSKFSGSLSANGMTQLLPLSGSGSGTFYGPTASELGGTFFLSGSTTTLIGGFGAKR